jgi:hypothetical protein
LLVAMMVGAAAAFAPQFGTYHEKRVDGCRWQNLVFYDSRAARPSLTNILRFLHGQMWGHFAAETTFHFGHLQSLRRL